VDSKFEHGVLALLSEAWHTERVEHGWLKGVVEAATPLLQPDLGLVGAIARAGRASAADLSIVPYAQGIPDDLFRVMDKVVSFSRSTSEMRRNFAARAPVMTFSEFSCYAELAEMLAPVGIVDVAVLFTGPVFGSSLAIAANYRERRYFTPNQRATLCATVSQLSIAFNAQRYAHGAEGSSEDLSKVLVPEQASVELRCAELLALGLDTKEIAVALDISPDAVRKHISNGMKRHGVQTREQLIELAAGGGLRLAV
jgi:hypothetical protein